jgi:pimeloyl-ACP methyl ester carboxylesterase
MATFVLVHGAWLGGWCWQRVAPHLRRSGHEVYTPTLTGLGERAHLLSRDVGLDTHVQDIVGVLECEDLLEVVLVGHSFGGMVVSCRWDRRAGRGWRGIVRQSGTQSSPRSSDAVDAT